MGHNRRVKRVEVFCIICNKKILKRQAAIDKYGEGKFCSIKCQHIHQSKTMIGTTKSERVSRVCKFCKKTFTILKSQSVCGIKGVGTYCSNRCRFKNIFGEKNPAWKGVVFTKRIDDPKYKKWRASVLERDGYACTKCGAFYPTELHAHHIIKWSVSVENRYKVGNGLTLCRDCHMKLHGLYSGQRQKVVVNVKDILIKRHDPKYFYKRKIYAGH
jgi:hypothetical protein